MAECLGKLTLVNPAALLPRLKQQLKTGRMIFKNYFIFLFFMSDATNNTELTSSWSISVSVHGLDILY